MRWLLKSTVTSTALISILFVSLARPQDGELVTPEIANLSLMIDGQSTEVAVHIYRPNAPGPFPIMIFTHGHVVPPSDLRAPITADVASWWLQKGFAVVAPVRPGYGKTGGAFREAQNVTWQGASCIGEPIYETAMLKVREVVLATVAWAQNQSWVRRDRVLLVGQSTGGLETIATIATNPDSVIGGINFAGGMGGNPAISPGKSCKPELLTAIYGQLGKTTRVPTLWLYAQNDLFWGTDAPKQWFESFKAGGSATNFVQTPPVPGGVDGHRLVFAGGPLWKPSVDLFLDNLKQ
jgi:dienelactone hydrolase